MLKDLFPFISGTDGKISIMAVLGFALLLLALMWAFKKIPGIKSIA